MKRILFAALVVLYAAPASAQPRMRVERLENKHVEFYLDNKQYPGTLTAFVTLRELTNCGASEGTSRYEVRSTGQRLFTLRPSDAARSIGYGYSMRTIEGRLDPPVDTTLVCRMPCSTRKPIRVTGGVYVLDKYRKPRSEQRRLGTHFSLQRGDTVYAARRGVVTDVKVAEKRAQDAPRVSFTSRSTSVRIEQRDGSFAWYVCLDGENLFVSEGDEVLPGTPLALAGTYDGERYDVSVQFYYLRGVPGEGDIPEVEKVHFFPPFLTVEESAVRLDHGRSYTPAMNEDLLTREMTKKEIKRLRLGRGK
ncbi:hypothetical protein [Alistipes sp.]|uniref:hypothetical protein n=1 Tax=Alistipes sp. TaxID=1872444 RepID=UPI003AF1ABD1